MTQEERRCCLIQYLLKEEIRFRKQKIPKDKQGQENLLRSLMNTRLPKPIKDSGRISYRKKQGARDHRHCRPDTGSI